MSRIQEVETTILRDEMTIYIDGVYIPGLPARRDEYGAPESPDDDPEVEITSATDEDGGDVELTDEETEEAMENIFNNK